jgi:hypothetical protein
MMHLGIIKTEHNNVVFHGQILGNDIHLFTVASYKSHFQV